jgi:hypothetical protein
MMHWQACPEVEMKGAGLPSAIPQRVMQEDILDEGRILKLASVLGGLLLSTKDILSHATQALNIRKVVGGGPSVS